MVFRGQDRGRNAGGGGGRESMESWMFSFHPQLTCLYLSKELVDVRVKMDRELNRRETCPDDARIRCE